MQEQNSQTAGGQIGDQPIAKGTEINATIVTQNRFTNPEQFENIILRANPDGSTVRLGDVARVELGAQNYLTGNELNGKPMAGIAVQLAPGANALATADGVSARMEELRDDASRRRHLVDPLRHHAVHHGLDRGGRQDAGRGDGARLPRDVPVPAELARHA